jgi:hypothetical protein
MPGPGQLYEVLGQSVYLPPRRVVRKKGEVSSLQLEKLLVRSSADDEAFDLDGELASQSGLFERALKAKKEGGEEALEAFGWKASGAAGDGGDVEEGVEAAADVEIRVHVKAATLRRVIEFFEHHRGQPCPPLKTPLDGETLATCGVAPWDAEFVGSGTFQELFDLMYASRLLDIPSLIFLTGAEAKVRLSGKDLSDVRQELELDNDLPPSEEEEIMAEWNSVMEKAGFEPNESILASLAATLHGLHMAAANGGLFEAARAEPGMVAPSTSPSWRRAVWHALVDEDWKLLQKAPQEITGDRDIMDDLMQQSAGGALKYAEDSLKKDVQLVRLAVSLNGKMLAEADDTPRGDKDFVLSCLALDGRAMKGATDELRGDKNFILEACGVGCGACLQGALPKHRVDPEFCLECIEKDPSAYSHIDYELVERKDFALKAAVVNGVALQFMPPRFKADKEIVEAALKSDTDSLYYAHVSRRADLGAYLATDSERSLKATMRKQEKYKADLIRMGKYESENVYSGHIYPLSVSLSLEDDGSADNFGKFRKLSHGTFICSFQATAQVHNAANMLFDRLPAYNRPELELSCTAWGNVGSVITGLRKEHSSADMVDVNQETLISINDCKRFINLCCTHIGLPELVVAAYSGEAEQTPSAQAGIGDSNYMPKVIPSENIGLRMPSKIWETEGTLAKGGANGGVPLGGWSVLLQRGDAPTAEKRPYGPAPAILRSQEPEDLELCEGAWVKVTGYQSLLSSNSKEGSIGRVVKLFFGGKAKVKLASEFAYIKTKDLQVVPAPAEERAPEAPVAEEMPAPQSGGNRAAAAAHGVWANAMHEYKMEAAEDRKLNIEERRAAIKARLEAKKQAKMQ